MGVHHIMGGIGHGALIQCCSYRNIVGWEMKPSRAEKGSAKSRLTERNDPCYISFDVDRSISIFDRVSTMPHSLLSKIELEREN